MKRLFHTTLQLLLCLTALPGFAATQHTDTISTRQGTKIILSYSVKHDGQRAIVTFDRPIFYRLGSEHQRLRDKKDKLLVWMFDERRSSYGGKKEKLDFNGLNPVSIISTRNASYKRDEDNTNGFVTFYDDAELTFSLQGSGSPSVELPLYMVLYEGSRKHKLIDKLSHNLSIDLSKPASTPRQPSQTSANGQSSSSQASDGNQSAAGGHWVEETVREEQPVPGEEFTEVGGGTNVRGLIDKAKVAMALSGEELSPEAANAIIELAGLKSSASEEEQAEIDALIAQLQEKKGASAAAAAAAKAEQEAKAKEAEEKAKEEQESNKKRTWWMVIGGGLLAILLFVGNQVMQSVRNRAQVRSMQELQDRAMQQASGKVKQTTQQALDQQMKQAEQAALSAGRRENAPSSDSATEPAAKTETSSTTVVRTTPKKVDRSSETLQEKAERAARGARIKKNRDKDGKISI